ncbi:MAG: TIGR00266 family protein [Snowella sp.]|nr:TIGR00266 family protein [Snowella sp.]
MKVEILNQPNNAIAHIFLKSNEEVIAKAGAMMMMSNNLQVSTSMQRGSESTTTQKKSPLKDKFLFLNSFKANEETGELYLAPPIIGDIFVYQMTKYKLIVRVNAYLASSSKIEIFSGFHKFKTLLSNESNAWLSLVGDGQVLINSFGRLSEVDVEDNFVINLKNVIAFENSLNFKLIFPQTKGLASFIKKKESLCQFQGQGKILYQTHSFKNFFADTQLESSFKPS